MTAEVQSHQTKTEMTRSAPAVVDAGAEMALKVKVSCSSLCDLRGEKVRILAEDSTLIRELALTCFQGGINETDEFAVTSPAELGEQTWTAGLPAQEAGGVDHEGSSTLVRFKVRRHETSMAVWDFPSPAVMNSRFGIKVGVKCSAECRLSGAEVEIYGDNGKRVASGVLGRAPWPGTAGLFWAELELQAPDTEGYRAWEARFPKPDLDLPHEEASVSFAFVAARPPEHVVTVEATDQESKAPLKGANVDLHSRGTPYRGRTDDAGVARVVVPTGEYQLNVLMANYWDFQTTVSVIGDASFKAELSLIDDQWH